MSVVPLDFSCHNSSSDYQNILDVEYWWEDAQNMIEELVTHVNELDDDVFITVEEFKTALASHIAKRKRPSEHLKNLLSHLEIQLEQVRETKIQFELTKNKVLESTWKLYELAMMFEKIIDDYSIPGDH